MNNNSKKITYVFLQGRKQRLEKNNNISKEFFYSYFYAKDNFESVEIIEMENYEKKISQYFLRKFDSFINKLTKLPIYTYAIFKKKNIKKFLSSDYIIFSNDRVAFSSLPLILITKKRNPNVNMSFFVMGLFRNEEKYQLQKYFRKNVINYIFKKVDHVFFLGKEEYDLARSIHIKYIDKFIFLPFSVDIDFWQSKSLKEKNEHILFIGNDGNRDYEFTLKLARKMKDFKFYFITQKITNKSDIPKNVTLLNGSWGTETYTDEEIRDFYNESRITILPIKNTNQPSGQSVTLQSMAMGTPVIISNIDGFWDKQSFINNEHIIFVDENTLDNWEKAIIDLFSNEKKLNYLAKNGSTLIQENYNLNLFNKKVFDVLNLNND
jgi:glycosyltransferase involved in cell wall biosynthesis